MKTIPTRQLPEETEEPDPLTNTDDNIGVGVNLNLNFKMDITLHNSFYTMVDYMLSPRMLDPIFFLQLKIGDFNDEKSFILEYARFCLEVLSKYDYIYGDFKSELEPKFKQNRINVEHGFRYNDFINKLKDSDHPSLNANILAYSTRDTAINIKEVLYFGLPEEAELISFCHNVNLEKFELGKIDVEFDMIRMLSNDTHVYQKPKKIDPDFDRTIRPPMMLAFGRMIRENQFLESHMMNVGSTIINSKFSITTKSGVSASNFRELLNSVNARAGLFNSAFTFPTQIKLQDGKNFLTNLLLASFMGEFVRISYDVDFENGTLAMLIGCITMKACVPLHFMDPDSALDIDNYLAKYLLPGFPAAHFNANGYVFDLNDANMRTKNFLSLSIRGGAIRGLRSWETFLLTTSDGAGWGTAGIVNPVTPPSKVSRYFNDRKYYYVPISGVLQNFENSIPQQFINFSAAINAVTRVQFSFAGFDNNFNSAFKSLLVLLSNKTRRWSGIVWHLDKTIRKLNLLSIAHPIVNIKEQRGDIPYVTMPVLGAYSAIINIEGSSIGLTKPIDINELFGAMMVHKWANEFTEKLHYFRDVLVKPYFTRSDAIREAVSKTISDPGFAKIFYDDILDVRHIDDFSIPDVNLVEDEFFRKLNATKNMIETLRPLQGWDRDFYVREQSVIYNEPPLKNLQLNTKREFDLVLDRLALDKKRQFNQTTIISEIINKGGTIKMDIPIRITTKMVSEIDEQPIVMSFEKNSATQFNPLEFQWGWIEDKDYETEDKIFVRKHHRFTIDNMPFINEGISFVEAITNKIDVLKPGLRIFDKYDLIPRDVVIET